MENILDKWLKINGKVPVIGRMLEVTDKILVNRLPIELQDLLEPFLFCKVIISQEEIEKVERIFYKDYMLKNFKKLYDEMYGKSKFKVKPVVSTDENINIEQYIATIDKENITLKYLLIPKEKVNNVLFTELYIKNYIFIFNNLSNLDIALNYNYANLIRPTINLLDITNTSDYVDLKNKAGVLIGKYINTGDRIVIYIGDTIYYWDKFGKYLKFNVRNTKRLFQLLALQDITDEEIKNKTLLKIKQNKFLEEFKNIKLLS